MDLLPLLFLAIWASSFNPCDAAPIYESSGGFTGRSLLQAEKTCTVDFQNQNYTIITSRCKGPTFPPKACCLALKEFACPFVDQIDDLSTNCADTMFSYITLSGNYPPGLFANECKEGKEGLDCSNFTTTGKSSQTSSSDKSSSDKIATTQFAGVIFPLVATLIAFFFLYCTGFAFIPVI